MKGTCDDTQVISLTDTQDTGLQVSSISEGNFQKLLVCRLTDSSIKHYLKYNTDLRF